MRADRGFGWRHHLGQLGEQLVITSADIVRIAPYSKPYVDRFVNHLNAAMDEFDINTPQRRAAFLAQVLHESGQLRYVKELATGKAYEGRADLGNTQPGDGVTFKGRGLIQITGRVNYVALMLALEINCLTHPELLEVPEYACRSAGWFWKTHGCNEIADTGDFLKLTRRINGGTNGIVDREALYVNAKKILGV